MYSTEELFPFVTDNLQAFHGHHVTPALAALSTAVSVDEIMEPAVTDHAGAPAGVTPYYDTEFDRAVRNLFRESVRIMESTLSPDALQLINDYLGNLHIEVTAEGLRPMLMQTPPDTSNNTENNNKRDAVAVCEIAGAFQATRRHFLPGAADNAPSLVQRTLRNQQNNITRLVQNQDRDRGWAVALNVLLTVFVIPLLASPLFDNREWRPMRFTFFNEKEQTRLGRAYQIVRDIVGQDVLENSQPPGQEPRPLT